MEECWAPAMEDRPDFKDITKRFEIIWGEPLYPTGTNMRRLSMHPARGLLLAQNLACMLESTRVFV